ncbi:hypothetical protein HYX11_03275 [Candidatus Woesearchaeota archaeon]|nr:hypothetical protein [Candidatus Woesearchaeota archaeon]
MISDNYENITTIGPTTKTITLLSLESLVQGALNALPQHQIIIVPSEQCSLLTNVLDKKNIPYTIMPPNTSSLDNPSYYIIDLNQINITNSS